MKEDGSYGAAASTWATPDAADLRVLSAPGVRPRFKGRARRRETSQSFPSRGALTMSRDLLTISRLAGEGEDSASVMNAASGVLSSTDRPRDKFDSAFDPWGDYLFAFIMIVIGFVSLAGNSLAVHVFRRKGAEITVPEVLLLNIAVVDLFLAIASYPATIVSAFSHRWAFGEAGCTMYAATCYFLGLATILSLTALAIFRFIKACFPAKGHWLTIRTIRIIIALIYVYSLAWACFPFFGWGGYDVEPFGLSCTLAWGKPDQGGESYVIAVSVFCVFLPTVIIIGSHIGILAQIRRSGQMFMNKAMGKQSSKAEVQFIRVSFGVCFGFLIAWLPYACFSLWSAYGDASSIPLWLTPAPVLLAKSSIAYNPVIYVLLTRRYRVDFTKALRELLHLSGAEGAKLSSIETSSNKIQMVPMTMAAPITQHTDGSSSTNLNGSSKCVDSDSEHSEVVEVFK